MLSFGLKVKRVVAGACAFAALYVVVEPGGIAVRLLYLAMAIFAGALWWEAKESLTFAALERAIATVEIRETEGVAPTVSVQPQPEWVKMPARYPRPVYIHRLSNFHLHTY